MLNQVSLLAPWPQRPSAIRTRIKTTPLLCSQKSAADLRDHLPLEQGLRLSGFTVQTLTAFELRDHLPLEQGLRLSGLL